MSTLSDANSRPRACVFEAIVTQPRRSMATPNSGEAKVDVHERRSKTGARAERVANGSTKST